MANQSVPTTGNDPLQWLRKLAPVVNKILRGGLNVTGTVTLTDNDTTTTITDDRISIDSAIILVPTTANAAAELGAGTLYMDDSARMNGSIVVTHANNAQTDRTFRYLVMG